MSPRRRASAESGPPDEPEAGRAGPASPRPLSESAEAIEQAKRAYEAMRRTAERDAADEDIQVRSSSDIRAIADLLLKGRFEHTPQTPEEIRSQIKLAEAQARHEQEEKQKAADHERDKEQKAERHRRLLELISLIAVLVVTAVVCPWCLIVLSNPAIPQAEKTWAAPIITLIVGGLLGYLTGRIPGRPPGK